MYRLECIWQPLFILGLVTTENVVGNGMAERLEKWALVNVEGNNIELLGKILVFIALLLCTFVRL